MNSQSHLIHHMVTSCKICVRICTKIGSAAHIYVGPSEGVHSSADFADFCQVECWADLQNGWALEGLFPQDVIPGK